MIFLRAHTKEFLRRHTGWSSRVEKHPAYFEFLFGMAMLVFKEQKVQYIVLETGMGGRLDSTNVVKKPLMTVITSVSMDHMHVLGNTIEEIASKKRE